MIVGIGYEPFCEDSALNFWVWTKWSGLICIQCFTNVRFVIFIGSHRNLLSVGKACGGLRGLLGVLGRLLHFPVYRVLHIVHSAELCVDVN